MKEINTISEGKVVAVVGEIANVVFSSGQPAISDVVTGSDGDDVVLIVYGASGKSTYACIILRGKEHLSIGYRVYATGEGFSIPVGNALLGRVINIFGE